jgi:hypothetical protein
MSAPSQTVEGSFAPDWLFGLQSYSVCAHMHYRPNRTRDVGVNTALRLETSPLLAPHSPAPTTHCNIPILILNGMYLLSSVRHHADASVELLATDYGLNHGTNFIFMFEITRAFT